MSMDMALLSCAPDATSMDMPPLCHHYATTILKGTKIGRRDAAKCQHIRIFAPEKEDADGGGMNRKPRRGPANGDTYYIDISKPNQ